MWWSVLRIRRCIGVLAVPQFTQLAIDSLQHTLLLIRDSLLPGQFRAQCLQGIFLKQQTALQLDYTSLKGCWLSSVTQFRIVHFFT